MYLNQGVVPNETNTNSKSMVVARSSSPCTKVKTLQNHKHSKSKVPKHDTIRKTKLNGSISTPNMLPLNLQHQQTAMSQTNMMKSRPSFAAPDPKMMDVDPDTFLKLLVEARCGYRPVVKASVGPELEKVQFFTPPTLEQIAAYESDVINAGRDNNVGALKSFYFVEQKPMECSNRFGESLLHLACRRGFTEMTAFLLQQQDGPLLSARIRDDCGRTPFHDACWNATPQLDICKMLLEKDPTLLLLSDKRGHTPFQYARSEHWGIWRDFLFENRMLFDTLAEKETMEVFS